MTTSTKIANLVLEDTEFPLLTPTILNQEIIEKNGNFITINRLAQLKVALDALQPTPPNATTVWFDNTILLQDASMTSQSLTINPTSINSSGNITIDPLNTLIIDGNLDMNANDIQNVNSIILDTGISTTATINQTNFTFSDNNAYRIGDANGLSTLDMLGDNSLPANSFATLGSETLNFNFTQNCNFNGGSTFNVVAGTFNVVAGPIVINSQNSTTQIGDVNTIANGTNLTIDDFNYLVNTNAIMMTAYNNSYILPICYTHKMSSGINYIGVNNTWQNVYQDNMNTLPNEFFNLNNTFWDYKIEFSINLRNVSNPGDGGLALYFEILDGNSVVYTPFLFNQNTPFTRHSNGSTYTATSVDMLTFTWTDTISFNNSVVPVLTFSLWWYGNNNNAPDFDAVVSLTRTNLV